MDIIKVRQLIVRIILLVLCSYGWNNQQPCFQHDSTVHYKVYSIENMNTNTALSKSVGDRQADTQQNTRYKDKHKLQAQTTNIL